MSCTSFRERLLDLAVAERSSGVGDRTAGLAAHDPLLSAHLEACAGCRDALAARRAVLGAVDRVLADELRDGPSPLLAAQVRQQIDSMEVPHSSWHISWARSSLPVAAAGIVVLALVLLARGFLSTPGPNESPRVAVSTEDVSSPNEVAPTPSLPAERTTELSRLDTARREMTPARRPSPRHPSATDRGVSRVREVGAPPSPEVIVPAGELMAAVLLSEASFRHPLNVRAQESDRPDGDDRLRPLAALTIEKIEIAPVVLKPVDTGAPRPADPVNL